MLFGMDWYPRGVPGFIYGGVPGHNLEKDKVSWQAVNEENTDESSGSEFLAKFTVPSASKYPLRDSLSVDRFYGEVFP